MSVLKYIYNKLPFDLILGVTCAVLEQGVMQVIYVSPPYLRGLVVFSSCNESITRLNSIPFVHSVGHKMIGSKTIESELFILFDCVY